MWLYQFQLTSAYSCFVIKPEGKCLDVEEDEALVVATMMARSDDEDDESTGDHGLMAIHEGAFSGRFPGQCMYISVRTAKQKRKGGTYCTVQYCPLLYCYRV